MINNAMVNIPLSEIDKLRADYKEALLENQELKSRQKMVKVEVSERGTTFEYAHDWNPSMGFFTQRIVPRDKMIQREPQWINMDDAINAIREEQEGKVKEQMDNLKQENKKLKDRYDKKVEELSKEIEKLKKASEPEMPSIEDLAIKALREKLERVKAANERYSEAFNKLRRNWFIRTFTNLSDFTEVNKL